METIREFPASSTIEKSVLSVITQYPEKADEAPGLTPEHFHTAGLAEYFRQVSDMMREDGVREIDSSRLLDNLARSGTLERMGGPSALASIYSHCPSPLYFGQHVKMLNQFLARRMAIKAAAAMSEAAYEQMEIDELVGAISGPITAIHDTLGDVKPPTSTKSLVRASLQRYLDRANGKATPMGIETGIFEIDSALKGLHAGRMWVIGAYPSGGKSVLAGQVVINIATNGTPAVFVTLEMSEDDLMDRMMIQAAKAKAVIFTDPKAYAEETGHNGPTEGVRRLIEKAAEKILQSPLAIRRPSNRTLSAVVATIRRACREMGAKVAVVDYVQLITAKATSKEQEVSEISHAFQELAKELGIALIVLTQLNAEGDTKHGRVIEEDADAFLQIVQEMDKKKDNFKQWQHILIAKDRHYSKGGEKLPLIFYPETIRFGQGFPEKTKQTKTAGF